MIYHLVQPWGRDKYRQAGRISSHPTVEEVYAELDRIATMLAEDDLPEDTLELYVVDEHREAVPRPGAHWRALRGQCPLQPLGRRCGLPASLLHPRARECNLSVIYPVRPRRSATLVRRATN